MSRRFLADAIPTGAACCVVRDGKSKAVVNSREVFLQNEKILRTIMLLNRVETLSIVGSKHRTGDRRTGEAAAAYTRCPAFWPT